ncbi:hypothetical protein D0C36_08035 [Mucilaginibacter conchicola]|uniref:Uncharacterized protein n=1 Tax=Mucilaginibacter conchicola TaxID=2303333 RepID=A0A372NZB7_9SPHI|nr:hypothetical protein [Mucilaginibacter conchicola]RFZ95460.1 hypothetical protein D0C36_08035 [Mucilaginibacter conchicola]
MKKDKIFAGFLKTICWHDNKIVDWASGAAYNLKGERTNFGYTPDFGDRAICSANGEYAFVYKRLGTKELLLKNGKLLREINRPYYCSDAYEYPAAFVTIGARTYLIHCPVAYNQLDFEDAETGELVTNISGRNPDDFFHSRLEVSAGGKYLLDKGWVWHPIYRTVMFDIEACLRNPLMLDNPQLEPKPFGEYCTASFIDNSTIVVGSSDEVQDEEDNWFPAKHIAVWDLKTDKLSEPVKVRSEFGNIFAISSRYVWDMYKYPKIINVQTGEVVDEDTGVKGSLESSPMTGNSDNYPAIAFNRHTKQIAVQGDEEIIVLTPDEAFLSATL